MKKTAIITGGSRGIGAAAVRQLAENGWQVIALSAHRPQEGSALAERLRSEGLDVSWQRCDVSDPESVSGTFTELARTHHHVDALVCSAGTALIRLFQDTAEADWDALYQTHIMGTVRCARAVLPGMISRGSGSIVTVSSMWGQVGASCESAYATMKAGLIGLTKSLAAELGPSGIRVNCVAPGVIDTAMNADLTEDTMLALREEIPLGRIGTAAEAAAVIRFLCEPDSAYVTGQVLGVNGGMVL